MKVSRTRYLTLVAIFSAISFGLMFLDFAIPAVIPSFVKMDFSELPALIASFALGPSAGVLVCLIKNLIHLSITTTSGVGELANFLIGAALVFPAGMIYKYHKNKKFAIIACFAGAIIM
nr:ECF transporter S component [Clostridia bacterium]